MSLNSGSRPEDPKWGMEWSPPSLLHPDTQEPFTDFYKSPQLSLCVETDFTHFPGGFKTNGTDISLIYHFTIADR